MIWSQNDGLGHPWQERQSLTRKQENRRELDQFFSECLTFISGRQSSGGKAIDSISEGVAAFAFQKFGALASNVLRHWGIGSPEELEQGFVQFLKACGSRGTKRTAGFSQSEALKALFRGEYWP